MACKKMHQYFLSFNSGTRQIDVWEKLKIVIHSITDATLRYKLFNFTSQNLFCLPRSTVSIFCIHFKPTEQSFVNSTSYAVKNSELSL